MAKTNNKQTPIKQAKETETNKLEEPKKETPICEQEKETTPKVDVEKDLISRQKVVDTINSTMLNYKGKVVLAMIEVKDIINTILAAIKE